MKRAFTALASSLLLVSAASAAPLSQEAKWYGSGTGSSIQQLDDSALESNVAMLRECLKEHNGRDRENCIGVTKSYCDAEQPTCNIQEAAAWNALYSKKHSARAQASALRAAEKSCGYTPRMDQGYANINLPDPWAAKLAPSGCVLQRAAHRALATRRK